MTIQVNPIVSPRIITIPEADGESITIQSLVNQIRNWEDSQANLAYPSLLSASGKEDLGGGTLVGITASLENTKLKFEARGVPTTCYVGGGNLVAVDENGNSMFPISPSTNVTVQLTQSSSATMIQSDTIDEIQIQVGEVHYQATGIQETINLLHPELRTEHGEGSWEGRGSTKL